MPEIPAFLADAFAPRFARPSRVERIETLSSNIRRIRFALAPAERLRFCPGQEVEFRVGATSFRHYTPSELDPIAGRLEVIFYLHGSGPGSAWAAALRPGDPAPLLGPGGRFKLDEDAASHLLLGDETCLGLFCALCAAAPGSVRGAIEVDAINEGVPRALGLPLDAVVRDASAPRGAALRAWLRRASPSGGTAYLAGHAQSIAALRQQLTEKHGYTRRSIRTKAYWADGKRGL